MATKKKSKSGHETETRAYWMMRGLDGKSSLLFSVPLTITETDPGLFEAEIHGMEDRMVASGTNPDEAAEHATLVFMATVDDALEHGQSAEFATGIPAMHLNFPVSMYKVLIDAIEKEQAETEHKALDRWVSLVAAAAQSESGQHA